MDSGLQCPAQTVVLVLTNSAALVSHLFLVPLYFLLYLVPFRKMMPNSVNFRREVRMVLLEQVGFQTFPEVPLVFRVSNGNPGSRQSIPLGLGIIKGWLGTWDAPELLAVSRS